MFTQQASQARMNLIYKSCISELYAPQQIVLSVHLPHEQAAQCGHYDIYTDFSFYLHTVIHRY